MSNHGNKLDKSTFPRAKTTHMDNLLHALLSVSVAMVSTLFHHPLYSWAIGLVAHCMSMYALLCKRMKQLQHMPGLSHVLLVQYCFHKKIPMAPQKKKKFIFLV